jgi:hypothetical protein
MKKQSDIMHQFLLFQIYSKRQFIKRKEASEVHKISSRVGGYGSY